MNPSDFASSVLESERVSAIAKEGITWKQPRSLDDRRARFPGFHQRRVHYRAGQVVNKGGHAALVCDLVMHESVAARLPSDGTTLYCDIFLPGGDGAGGRFDDLDAECPESERVPAIVAWSPYGKQGGTQLLSDFPFHGGVPPAHVSGLQKWEGPDPAFWCDAGYAMVNVDIRGAYTSEGDAEICGHQEARDGAEFVAWLARQRWCNGRVGMSGNSWLAVAQWKIAALRPDGLACIAPWEGMMDMHRDVICKGGIPDTGFVQAITSAFAGKGRLEDMAAAAATKRAGKEAGLFDEYWADKVARVERINVPIYAVVSWTSLAHTNGTLRAFRLLHERVPRWLRVHNSQEWPDYYEHRNVLDLKRFFDWSLKGQTSNGWTNTPPVRLSVLHLGIGLREDTVDRAESEWPLARTKYTNYYLGPDKSLSTTPPTAASTLDYDSTAGSLVFEYTIPHAFEMTGYPRARLYLSTRSSLNPKSGSAADSEPKEIDIFVQIEKFTAQRWRQGTLVLRPKSGPACAVLKLLHDWHLTSKLGLLYHWGSDGRLRASFAHTQDASQTAPFEPVYACTERRMLKAGEVVCLTVPMRAYGMYWDKDDVLRFTVSGRPIVPFGLPGCEPLRPENDGVHSLYVGGRGEESSCLVLPVV